MLEKLEKLNHTILPTPSGAKVIILDNGAIISPESQAMLGALHSRNPKGMESHLESVAKRGSDDFMAQFYVGYGHKSIADLAPVFISIEGVSMLAAKAIQDFPLYRGQEVSTRYVDYTSQPFICPTKDPELESGLDILRAQVLKVYDSMVQHLTEKYPCSPETDPKIHEKAIRAKSFDVCRGLLPAGASTNLNWSGDFRQVQDHLSLLSVHPLQEVKDIASTITYALSLRYPSSFPGRSNLEVDYYNQYESRNYSFKSPYEQFNWPDQLEARNNIDTFILRSKYWIALQTRPERAELPWDIREAGVASFKFSLDFGSYRDLQRHRPVTIPMPLLTTHMDFESWYLEMMPGDLRAQVLHFLVDYTNMLRRKSEVDPLLMQYYTPMGFKVPIRLTGDLRALTYLVELRSSRFVHPTLRRRAKEIAQKLKSWFSYPIYLDDTEDSFDPKRGTHDIVSR